MQPRSLPIAGEAADDDLAAEDAQAPLDVAELAPDLQGQGARVLGRILRILGCAEPHVHAELRRLTLHDPEEQVAPDEQVQHLAHGGRPVVDDGHVGDVGKVGGGQVRQERHHLAEALEIGGLDLEDGVGAVGVGFRRRQRGLAGGHVVEVVPGGIAQQAPAIREDPRAARGGGAIRARLDAGHGHRIAQGQVRLAPRHAIDPEPIEAPLLTTVGSTFQSASVCRFPFVVVARG